MMIYIYICNYVRQNWTLIAPYKFDGTEHLIWFYNLDIITSNLVQVLDILDDISISVLKLSKT